jgi:SNF2 family DNA or RNA helicase
VLVLDSIDGQTPLSARQESIKEYNREESETFIFLMSTRAGGIGVDLVCIPTLSLLFCIFCYFY